MNMKQLPPETVRLLTSSQVITSVLNVVKELVENSLDAGASSIEVKLDNYGFDRIEVRDNGIGIEAADAPVMAVKHYTSKISSHDDLESLETYGFRGEALGALCAVSEVIIITKTASDDVSTQYTLDFTGNVVSQKPSHLGQGTTVTVLKLFKNLPVRKQFYSTAKKCKEELKKVQDLLMAYAIIKPELRMIFTHNKAIVWQKARVSDHKMALMSVLGTALMSSMLPFQHHQVDPEVTLNGFLPKPGSDNTLTSSSSSDKTFVFVNQRPVHLKEVMKLVRQYYSSQSCRQSAHSRCPVLFMNIVVPAASVDINLTPDKTQVMLQNKENILSAVETILISVYGALPGSVPKDVSKRDVPMSVNETDSPDSRVLTGDTSLLTLNTGNENTSVLLSEPPVSFDKTMPTEPLESTSSEGNCQIIKNACEFGVTFTLDDERILMDTQQGNGLKSAGENGLQKNPGVVMDTKADGTKDSSEMTAESWSMGHALKDSSTGEKLEPVKVFVPHEKTFANQNEINLQSSDSSQNKSPCKKLSNAVTEKMAKVTAYDLISNRTVRQPMSASAIFEQEIRPRILEENPKASLQEIISSVEDMWKNLSEEEQKKYEDKAEKDMDRYKLQTKKASEQNIDRFSKGVEKRPKLALARSKLEIQKRKAPLSNQQIIDKLFQSQKEKKSNSEKVFKAVPFSVNSLKLRLRLLSEQCHQKSEGLQLVNRLGSHSAWVVLSGRKLMLLNPSRVEEALLFKRLMETNILPAECLDTPIKLTDGVLGGPQYTDALCSMEKEGPTLNGVTYFSDPRLVSNGFKVRLIPGGSTAERHLEVAGMSDCVPYYSTSDLKEILNAVLNRNAKSVQQCRPLKVKNYLQGEAVRLARQLPLTFSREDIEDTISRMKEQLGNDSQSCTHGRPFFHLLREIPEKED
ncbi:PMS1 protein homolog 1-like [Acipenser ruthenus]|uniref:PMS1 protein homolog 1-like n=1 Tax=Acipenser ruthenus TaxID=7906 RepID=UPI002740FC5D|nr:PMS1 protein homolog 1-like [Acipenser ruthenus]XP_033900373.3 PMS1 protein homolog 1-like [Acipenser ruthenus]XP_033900374.3 PMS1 protein homolog 1-like [Acipenser ruthenus]XP_033900375.3 PMS1 protein homolog 1-like [Acipenser ruthenus]XP_058889580.1 PMS1 protein homolog 1-like [Acipenser ruthenus]